MPLYKPKRMIWIFIVSAATALLAIISGYLQYKEKLDASQKNLKKEQEINAKSDEIIRLQKENKDETDNIRKLQQINQEKTDEIVRLQGKLQEKTDELINSLRDEANMLSTLSLMDKYIIPRIRVIFSFTKPVNKMPETDRGKEFQKLVNKFGERNYNIGTYDGVGNINPSGYAFDRGTYMTVDLQLGGIKGMRASVDPVGAAKNLVYIEGGKQCLAFEFTPISKMNLANFYTELRENEAKVTLNKLYKKGTIKSEIDIAEDKFKHQDVTVSIEIPLNETTGTWFKVDLYLTGEYSLKKYIPPDNDDFPYPDHFTEYIWKTLRNSKGFFYNKIEETD